LGVRTPPFVTNLMSYGYISDFYENNISDLYFICLIKYVWTDFKYF